MADETQDERWERLSRDREKRPLPKRFYKSVEVGPDRSILLDGRGVKTPLKAKLALPTEGLAQAVALEWREQRQVIDPASMPLTKLANTVIDKLPGERAAVEADVVGFAGNDLVCYRTATPPALVKLHQEAWDPVLAWADVALGARFVTVVGVIHKPQEKSAIAAVAEHLRRLTDCELAAVHNLTTLSGSALLSLMLEERAISAGAAWSAAHVDEDFQTSQWGEDFEAVARRCLRKAEFDATCRFLNLCRPSN